MTDRCGASPYLKGEPTATDAARLRRGLTDDQKAELRASIRRLLAEHAVLNPPADQAG